jgi:hypothetical protein
MNTKMKYLAIGAVTFTVIPAVMLGTVIGIYAQSSPNPVIEKAAQILGVEPSNLESALKQARLEELDQKVASGEIDSDRADKIRERIEAGELGVMGAHHRMGVRDRAVEFLAEYIGATEAATREQLRDGKTPEQLIKSAGKSAEEFKTKLLAEVKQKLQAAVTDGQITQEVADARYALAPEHIDNFLKGKVLDRMGMIGTRGGRSR